MKSAVNAAQGAAAKAPASATATTEYMAASGAVTGPEDPATEVGMSEHPRQEAARIGTAKIDGALASPASRALGEAAVRLHALGGGATELRLDPPELGRVRLSVSPVEGGVTVVITAERPETADLFRRHSDQLLQLLERETGSGATLDFGEAGAGHGPWGDPGDDPADEVEGTASAGPGPSSPVPVTRRIASDGGSLDLRL